MSGRDVADECWPGRNIEAEAVDMTNPSSRRKRTMVELALSCCTVHSIRHIGGVDLRMRDSI